MDAVIGRYIGGCGVGRFLWTQPRSLASYMRCNQQRRVGHMQTTLEPIARGIMRKRKWSYTTSRFSEPSSRQERQEMKKKHLSILGDLAVRGYALTNP